MFTAQTESVGPYMLFVILVWRPVQQDAMLVYTSGRRVNFQNITTRGQLRVPCEQLGSYDYTRPLQRLLNTLLVLFNKNNECATRRWIKTTNLTTWFSGISPPAS